MTGKSEHLSYETINTRILKITSILWLTAKLISWRIWTTYRLYPLAPVFESFDKIPPVIHLILFILSIAFIVLLFLFNKNKYILAGLLLIEIASCMLDQNRWQPWEYQNIFIIFICLINLKKRQNTIAALTFILASTYFFSGCGKLNGGFLQNIWAHDVLKSFLKVPVNITRLPLIYYSGWLLALFELLCGIGLLFPKTQKAAARALILMHLFILLFLGPAGINYNAIVWPWNVAMILYLYTIFLKNNESVIILKPILEGWNKLLFVFWGILPALSFIGYWDSLLSSSIYSGNAPKMIVCIRDTTKSKRLQPFYTSYSGKVCKDAEATINLHTWILSETDVIPNPEKRVYKIIKNKLEKQYAAAGLNCSIFINGQKQ